MHVYGSTTTAAVAVASLALVLAGCGGGEDPGRGADEPSPTPSSESPSSSSPAEKPTETPTEPEPTVEPASGPLLEVGTIRVAAPDRFKQLYDTPFTDAATGRVGGGRSGIVLLGAVADDEVGVRAAMKDSFIQGKTPEEFEQQDDTELGGTTAYYYTTQDTKFLLKHVMGRWDSGYLVHVDVSLPIDMPMTEQQEIVESVRLSYDSPSS